jgi:hypothetical protein
MASLFRLLTSGSLPTLPPTHLLLWESVQESSSDRERPRERCESARRPFFPGCESRASAKNDDPHIANRRGGRNASRSEFRANEGRGHRDPEAIGWQSIT